MRRFVFGCIAMLGCGAAFGAGWQIRSARSLGMGGAGVALSDDAGAHYWNPAALGTYAKGRSCTVDVVANAGFLEGTTTTLQEITALIESERELYDLFAISEAIENGTATDEEIQTLLGAILVDFAAFFDANLGLLADGNASAAYAQPIFGGKLACSFGYSAYGEATVLVDLLSMALYAGVDATQSLMQVFAGWGGAIDRDGDLTASQLAFADELEALMIAGSIVPADADLFSDELVYQSVQAGVDVLDPDVQDMLSRIVDAAVNGTGEFIANDTGLAFEGIILQETRLAFGYPVVGKSLSAGISLNIMQGETYKSLVTHESIWTSENLDDILAELVSPANTCKSTRVGVDLGLLYRPIKMVSIGIVGHNVLPVEFAEVDGETFALKPQWRMGVAVRPLKDLLIAADMDLSTSPAEAIRDYKTQTYAAGIEYYCVPKILALRAGVAGDFFNQTENLNWTFGLGVGLGKIVRLDVGFGIEGDISGLGDLFSGFESIETLQLPDSVTAAVSFALNLSF